jgi:hypothetical protein
MDPEAAYSEKPRSSSVDLNPQSSQETTRRIDRAGRCSSSC